MMPAIGQGALGIECRSDDKELLDILNAVHDEEVKHGQVKELS